MQKIKKCEKPKQLEKIEKPKSCGSLDTNDGLRKFEETNMVNVKPKSTKLDEPILERMKPNPQHSLSNHVLTSLLFQKM